MFMIFHVKYLKKICRSWSGMDRDYSGMCLKAVFLSLKFPQGFFLEELSVFRLLKWPFSKICTFKLFAVYEAPAMFFFP